MKAPFLLGRLVFGGFFLYNGINHFKQYRQLVQYSKAKKVPVPEAAVLGSGALLTVGGASILLGVRPKLGSLAILGFLATASPSIHDFWNDQDAGQKQNNMAHFGKNMALLGAALAFLGVEEPWPASLHGKKEGSADEVEVEAEKKPLRLSQRRAERRRAA
jgi:putative oxidoreductase